MGAAGSFDPTDALIVDCAVDAISQAGVEACYHCGEALPASPVLSDVEGSVKGFCCEGCLAAAQWIRSSDLGDYYRLRSAAGARVDVELPDLAAWDRDDVLADHAFPVTGGLEITLLTDGMRCAACAWLINHSSRPVM